jgi:hypothetical protein
MTDETRDLMMSTLPDGYEVVEDRDYEGGEPDGKFYDPDLGWQEDTYQFRWSDQGWFDGHRYARKITKRVEWSSKVPTRKGWYWVRWPHDGPNEWQKPHIEDVYAHSDGLYIDGACITDLPCALWWPIPIEPPPMD